MALRVLCQLAFPSDFDIFVDALADEDIENLIEAEIGLYRIGNPAAIPHLKKRLATTDPVDPMQEGLRRGIRETISHLHELQNAHGNTEIKEQKDKE